MARIRTQLRRLQVDRAPLDGDLNGLLSFGPLEVNLSSRSVQVDGAPVPLTTMEYDIFEMLAKNSGSVIKRDDLYKRIIGTEYNGIDRGLDVHMSRIRRKLQGAGFDTSRLKSVRAVGYLLASQ